VNSGAFDPRSTQFREVFGFAVLLRCRIDDRQCDAIRPEFVGDRAHDRDRRVVAALRR